MCLKGELLVIDLTKSRATDLSNLTVNHSLSASTIEAVHILDWRGNLGAVISCENLTNIEDLNLPKVKDPFNDAPAPDNTIPNSDGNGLYVLVEQGGQPQALYRLDKGSPEGSDGRAGVLKIRFEFDFRVNSENREINKRRLAHLPEVLDNLPKLGSTIITINKKSDDSRTNDQLVAAAAFRHHQEKLSKQS
jgi:hypothetical protein